MGIVVQNTLSLVHSDDCTLPFSLKLEAIFEIGASGSSHMLKIIQGLEETTLANLSDVYVCSLFCKKNYSFKISWNALSVKKLMVLPLYTFLWCVWYTWNIRLYYSICLLWILTAKLIIPFTNLRYRTSFFLISSFVVLFCYLIALWLWIISI